MIADICVLKTQLRKLKYKLFGRWFKPSFRLPAYDELPYNHNYLLVIEPFEHNDDSSENDRVAKLNEFKKDFNHAIDAINTKVEKLSEKEDMEHNFLVLSKEVEIIKSKLSQKDSYIKKANEDLAEMAIGRKEIINILQSLQPKSKNKH
mmetsp:Transcript_59013/g.68263  ORF Transcript_59013/g.68263 Transcript_59013/m.68263 type:complete len:149 (+) Transcript_59013:2-448(+)